MSRQASSTDTPIWRNTTVLTALFWTGVGLAPLAALVLLIGGGISGLSLALVMGMASVVLIGLSLALRRDAETVEAELTAAMADLEEQTQHALSQLRGQLRQLAAAGPPDRGFEPGRPGAEAHRPPHRDHHDAAREPHPPFPHQQAPHHSPPRQDDLGHNPPPRQRDGDRHRAEPSRSDSRRDQGFEESDRYREAPTSRHYSDPNDGAGHRYPDREPVTGQSAQIPRPRPPHDAYQPPTTGEQRRRREAAMEETGEMVRVTESVSVTRRETTTMRPLDPDYEFEQAGNGPSGYQEPAPRTGKLGKLKLPKMGREHSTEDASAEADSLLSGLAPQRGHDDDWHRSDTGRDGGQNWDRPLPGSGGGRDGGGWHTEERSAELRMGMRQSRGGPGQDWDQREGDRRGAAGSQRGEDAQSSQRYGRGGSDGRDDRHGRRDSDRYAIADVEAEPEARWSEISRGGQQRPARGRESGGGSYMDRYYGER